jgi:hypothetical protein
VSLIDPDFRLMKNRGRIEPCYNDQVAVDDKNHLIVDYNVTNAPADNCQLSIVAKDSQFILCFVDCYAPKMRLLRLGWTWLRKFVLWLY